MILFIILITFLMIYRQISYSSVELCSALSAIILGNCFSVTLYKSRLYFQWNWLIDAMILLLTLVTRLKVFCWFAWHLRVCHHKEQKLQVFVNFLVTTWYKEIFTCTLWSRTTFSRALNFWKQNLLTVVKHIQTAANGISRNIPVANNYIQVYQDYMLF